MSLETWFRSRVALILAAVLLPPLGLLMLWYRPGTGILKKILATLPIAVFGIIHLHLFFGLRMQVDGSGMSPIFYFHKPESHFAELERIRTEQEESPGQVRPSARVEAVSASPQSVIGNIASTPPPQASSPPGPYWTDFRGPNRDGHYREMKILTDWPSDGLTELWRQRVGGGYASMVIAQGKAFTIEQRRDREVVAAYDIGTGREVWTNSWPAHFQESMGGDGPRATPTWHEGFLYALGATGEFRRLDAETGKVSWGLNILRDNGAGNITWGMSASPLIVDDKVIVLPGGASGSSVVAYDKESGKPVWKSLSDKTSYTSPMVVTLAGRRQLIVVSARRVAGLTVADGTLLWDYPWETQYDINVAQPLILGENRFFISAGYGHGAAVVEVSTTQQGYAARKIWGNIQIKNKFTSSVLHEGHIYGLDERILVCVDSATGERKWKSGRYGFGQLVLADGHLIVLSERGELALVKATPERHIELARFPAIQGKTWNHPAISGGWLLVRNTTEMACYKIASP